MEIPGFRQQITTLGLDSNFESLLDFDYLAGQVPVPSAPFMPAEAVTALNSEMKGASVYLEYGTGGSTMMASGVANLITVGVESDKQLLDAVKSRLSRPEFSGRFHFLYADIGPTKEWGYPTSESAIKKWHRYPMSAWRYMAEHNMSPDLVLIDGRFRRACFLSTLIFAKPGTRILFDDYFDRPHYHSVGKFLKPKRAINRLAEFERPAEVDSNEIWVDFIEAVTDTQ